MKDPAALAVLAVTGTTEQGKARHVGVRSGGAARSLCRQIRRAAHATADAATWHARPIGGKQTSHAPRADADMAA